jgi:phosphoribosyl 1,2-cyclic phosphodiesterase
MRFASLGSGSRGNATVMAADDTCLLVDCGFTLKETELRLARLKLSASDLTGVLVTHEHGDHIRGVGVLARKYDLPVYSSFGTRHAVAGGRQSLDGVDWRELRPGRSLMLGAIEVLPVPVPHDAREPCQYVFQYRQRRCGLLTDLGSITPHLVEAYRHCDALLLECNHDVQMLAEGAYPPSLKRRVGGDYGHLNNGQSAAFLRQLEHERLQQLVLSHLSEQNNTPELALAAITPVVGCDRVQVAAQDGGVDWQEIA